jgi:uncharacterized cofD-like protein
MRNALKLLEPGMEIKRWIGLALLGMVLISLGVAYIVVHVYRVQPLPDVFTTLTLQFIERPVRGAILFALGIVCLVVGFLKINQSLLAPFVVQPAAGNMVDTIYNFRARQRGPKIVVVGGGTGLSVALRGLKECTNNLTAIVTVADDGGSSGRLRRDLGVLPPGDFRNCMVALADVEPLMEDLFQYRFDQGSELGGHSFGNLFIVAMSEVTGNFERALQESSRVLRVRGRVLPSTLANVNLHAVLDDGTEVHGESRISLSGRRINRVYLNPDNAVAHPEAVRAILDADLVVVGPGSLYTSVLPNLVVPGICDALQNSKAMKVYVCNVATEPGETDGFGIVDHLDAMTSHLPGSVNPFHFVLANDHLGLPMPSSGKVLPVGPNGHAGHYREAWIVLSDVVDDHNSVRHHSGKLAETLMRLYTEHSASLGTARSFPEHV